MPCVLRRLPCHLLEILGKITRAEVDYMKQHGSYPDEEYVAKKLQLSVEKIHMVKQVYIKTIFKLDTGHAVKYCKVGMRCDSSISLAVHDQVGNPTMCLGIWEMYVNSAFGIHIAQGFRLHILPIQRSCIMDGVNLWRLLTVI